MIPASQPVKKKTIRLRSKALREIRSQQASTQNLIPTAPFHRLVKDIASEYGDLGDIRFRRDALDALQADAESYITEAFASSNLIAIAAGRETLHVEDLKLFQKIKG